MKKLIILTGLISLFVFSPNVFPQYTVLDALTLPSSAEMMGMGYASVSHITDNISALTFNPAQLGMQSTNNNFAAVSTNYIDWLPALVHGMYVRTNTAAAGVNLKRFNTKLPSISVGLAYTNFRFNSRSYYFLDGSVTAPPQYCSPYDVADQITLGVGTDYLVRAAAGITYKNVNSHSIKTEHAGLYDIGILIDVPVIKIISSIKGTPIFKYKEFTPFLDVAIGFAKCNMGKDSLYYYTGERGLISRYAREGLEYAVGMTYERDSITVNPLSFKWTIESNDQLGKEWYDWNRQGYQSGMGDIQFFKELIAGKGNTTTDKLKGWELGFFDMVMLYGGSFTEDYDHGNRNFLTTGFGFRLSGLMKTLSLLDNDLFETKTMQYISHNIDIKVNYSTITGKNEYSAFSGMKYYSLNLYWMNW